MKLVVMQTPTLALSQQLLWASVIADFKLLLTLIIDYSLIA